MIQITQMKFFFNFSIILICLIGIISCDDDQSTEQNISEEEAYFEDYESPILKWGFIDTTGRLVIEKKYDDLRPFNNGLAIANHSGKWGFINANGETIIEHKYRSAFPFKDGLARIQNFDKKYGFINLSGEMIIPDTFDQVFDFNSNRARALKNGVYGFIDTKGNWAINPFFKRCNNFQNDYAIVKQFGKEALIDTKGNYIIDFDANIQKIYSTEGKYIRVKKDNIIHFYKKSNFKLFPNTFDKATDFKGNYAVVKQGESWSIINTAFKTLHSFEAKNVKSADNNLWNVQIDNKYMIIDNNGNQITKKLYDMIFEFSEGLAPFQYGEFWGYINTKGEEILPAKLPLVWEFEEGFARAIISGQLTYIDKNINIPFMKSFADAHNFSEGKAHVQ